MRFTELVSITRDNFRSFLGGTKVTCDWEGNMLFSGSKLKSFRVQK